MIDAMGVTGVEGTFRRGAEESLRVLRENRHMLLTVLEVFLVDPLYKVGKRTHNGQSNTDLLEGNAHVLFRLLSRCTVGAVAGQNSAASSAE